MEVNDCVIGFYKKWQTDRRRHIRDSNFTVFLKSCNIQRRNLQSLCGLSSVGLYRNRIESEEENYFLYANGAKAP